MTVDRAENGSSAKIVVPTIGKVPFESRVVFSRYAVGPRRAVAVKADARHGIDIGVLEVNRVVCVVGMVLRFLGVAFGEIDDAKLAGGHFNGRGIAWVFGHVGAWHD